MRDEDREHHWVHVAEKSLIPKNEGRKVHWGDRQIAIFHLVDGFFAVDNRCPHRQGPLADGITAGGAVFCPLHNLKIDLASGCAQAGGEGKVRTYPVRLEGEDIYLGFEITETRIPMKEVMAIIRPSQWGRTKLKLADAGILAFTQLRVYGHGKQGGLKYWNAKKRADRLDTGISFIPKRLVIIVVPETQVRPAVNALIEANQTGAIGDGKIFVSPVEEVIQVRTGRNENRVKEMGGAVL